VRAVARKTLLRRLQARRCQPIVYAGRRLSLSRLSQQLISTNAGRRFLGLSAKVFCLLNEAIFEGSNLFESAACRHSVLSTIGYEWRPIKIAWERWRRLSGIGPSLRNPMRLCAFFTHASVFFPRFPRPLRRITRARNCRTNMLHGGRRPSRPARFCKA
jgi:hypothetical protein